MSDTKALSERGYVKEIIQKTHDCPNGACAAIVELEGSKRDYKYAILCGAKIGMNLDDAVNVKLYHEAGFAKMFDDWNKCWEEVIKLTHLRMTKGEKAVYHMIDMIEEWTIQEKKRKRRLRMEKFKSAVGCHKTGIYCDHCRVACWLHGKERRELTKTARVFGFDSYIQSPHELVLVKERVNLGHGVNGEISHVQRQ